MMETENLKTEPLKLTLNNFPSWKRTFVCQWLVLWRMAPQSFCIDHKLPPVEWHSILHAIEENLESKSTHKIFENLAMSFGYGLKDSLHLWEAILNLKSNSLCSLNPAMCSLGLK